MFEFGAISWAIPFAINFKSVDFPAPFAPTIGLTFAISWLYTLRISLRKISETFLP
ncbi:MAG: hypothetical protein GF311_23330 [Candidatus Lokiarchaeota archaeon]|nr:hypothetical protein [Candidatus Lokiarchaeota archaeon]